MSSRPNPSPQAKSFRSRMGTVMRRSSSALSFTRPGTPSRSSSESLRLDAKMQGTPSTEQLHSLPSPVPESPAREVAASVSEPQGPSKLSEEPVTASDPIDIPQKAPSPEPEAAVQHEDIAVPAPAPASVAVQQNSPEPEHETWTRRETVATPEPISPVHTYLSIGETAQSSQAEDPDSSAPSTDIHHDTLPQPEGPPPTEVYAAPWVQPVYVPEPAPEPASEPAPEPARQPTKPESVLRNPWISHEFVSEEAQAVPPPEASLSLPQSEAAEPPTVVTTPRPNEIPVVEEVVVGRPRSGTLAFDPRPHTPLPLNGRLSKQPSLASLASSVMTRGGPGPVVFVEPAKEGKTAPSAARAIDPDPFADPVILDVRSPLDRGEENRMPIPEPALATSDPREVEMPVAHPSATPEPRFYAQPIQNVPSGYSLAGKSSILMPMEHLDFDTDETRPLLPSMKDNANSSQPRSVGYYQPGESSIWPVPMRNFGALGWQEHVLPDGSTYFSHASLRVTVDVDLRNADKLDALSVFLDRKDIGDTLALPSEGWELWLRDAGRTPNDFIPARAWVNHAKKIVSLEQPPPRSEEFHIRDEDKLDLEYRYWSFIETHPAHAPLPPSSVSEAIDVLTWSYTDRLLPSSHPTPPPFTQTECQDLMALLRSLDGSANTSPFQSVVRTRVIAKILLRITAWRQGHGSTSETTSQDANRNGNGNPPRTSLRRTVGDFLISVLCLGVPYFFVDRSRHQRIDAESGVRSTAGPMLVVGACACVIASVILSASVTFLSLPGLDDMTRVAGFASILLSATSLVSAVLAVFRYKVDIERIPAYARGEGLITRRSLVLSLPLVFLMWAIVAFVTGVGLYAFRGLSTTNPGAISRHFQEYTQWAVVGAIGGLAGLLITSALLIRA